MYKAQSQDEEALVHAAAKLHMVFVNKNANIVGKTPLLLIVNQIRIMLAVMIQFLLLEIFTEIRFNASALQYEVLEILEFTSDRKRMSVVVRDCQSGKIILLSKGADEAVLPYAHAGKLLIGAIFLLYLKFSNLGSWF